MTLVMAANGSLLSFCATISAAPIFGVKPNLVVDGARIGLKRLRFLRFSLAEQRTHHSVEQLNGLIGEVRRKLQTGRQQAGMTAVFFKTRHMLHRRSPRFARQLGHPGLVNQMAAPRFNAYCTDTVEAFDDTQHARNFRRLGHLPQPGQPVLTRSVATFRQGIKPLALYGGQAFR